MRGIEIVFGPILSGEDVGEAREPHIVDPDKACTARDFRAAFPNDVEDVAQATGSGAKTSSAAGRTSARRGRLPTASPSRSAYIGRPFGSTDITRPA